MDPGLSFRGIAPAFPVPDLARLAAYRPSWFAAQLRAFNGPLRFGVLLRHLKPDRYAALARASAPNPPKPIDCYRSLLQYLDGRIPIHPTAFFALEEAGELGIETETEDYNPFFDGVPVDTVRPDPWEEELSSPAIALCWAFGEYSRKTDAVMGEMGPFEIPWDIPGLDCLVQFREQVAAWLSLSGPGGNRRPPRGRAWREEWKNVPDLWDLAVGMTDCPFLDYSQEDLMQMELPPWDLEHIRYLEEIWEKGQKIMERAHQLARFVDASPQNRLPLLAGILRGDKATLAQVTVITGKRATLAHRYWHTGVH